MITRPLFVVFVCGLGACILPTNATIPASGRAGAPRAPTSGPREPGENPFKDAYWLIRPNSNAARTAEALRRRRPKDAAAVAKIAQQPAAFWMGNWNPRIDDDVRILVKQHARSGALPVMVLYNLPFRDCGQHSAGGSKTPARYRAWIDAVARGLADYRAVFVLEPDGLPMLTKCLDEPRQQERLALVRYAVEKLKAKPGAAVYLDAGHSAWATVDDMAPRLQAAGIAQADGFALNVSNYQATSDLMIYGKSLSAAVGGKHFIIDTSRNGNGAPKDVTGDDERAWCNPPGRALGTPPTTNTGEPLCDAFYWLKPPGESDGRCNGGPQAGAWFAERAVELARNARWTTP